jgi:hypothetical protein
MKGEYLCKAHRVMPTHPMAVHLGDIKDMEDYKQKIVKQRKLRNKTIKAVRQYLTEEDIEKLEGIMTKPEKNKKEVTEITPRVITEKPLSRPIFGNKFERYEWHRKNGCHCQEDRDWLEHYMKSAEYTMMYGE